MDSKELDSAKSELEDWIKTNLDQRELKRALVVKWSLSGVSHREIQKLLKVSLGFISNWKNNFISLGIEGLKLAYKGRFWISKTKEQKRRSYHLVKRKKK